MQSGAAISDQAQITNATPGRMAPHAVVTQVQALFEFMNYAP
jgi:hypothetical protein